MTKVKDIEVSPSNWIEGLCKSTITSRDLEASGIEDFSNTTGKTSVLDALLLLHTACAGSAVAPLLLQINKSGRAAAWGEEALTEYLEKYWGYINTSPHFVLTPGPSQLDGILNTVPQVSVVLAQSLVDEVIETPTDAGTLHEPVIKGKGIPVWVLVSYVLKRHMSSEEVSQLWNGYVTPAEVRAAVAFSQLHPEDVEDKLSDER